MNEHEFRRALRTSMSATAEPPPMGEAAVLDAAKRDRTRRRAMWAGASSAVAVAAIAVGVVIVAPSTSGGGNGGDLGVGGAPPSVRPTEDLAPEHETTPARVVPDPGGGDTETQWPDGQTDRTATAGPQFDRGVALLAELAAVVPPGYESPDDLVGDGNSAGLPMRYHQAQYADTVDGVDVWEYMAETAVTKGDGVGRLLAQVSTPENRATGEGCDLATVSWGVEGECAEIVVDGKRVGVVTATGHDPERNQFEQWASYRHDDGTLVSVAQSTYRSFTEFPPLSGPVFTARQLAELAADPRFHLD